MAKMTIFYPIEIAIEQIKKDITRGASLNESLKKHSVFENKMISIIEVAEHVNQLETCLKD